MATFREGIENLNATKEYSIVEQDIIELGEKIAEFKDGKIPEDKFKALRLARGVYGQRQKGVQMIRIKLPFGKVRTQQLRRICKVSDEYSTGHLHITTRQDIQIHYVSLDRTPQLWAELEKDDVTLREACGNTVRNVTASPTAGINPHEVFDVAPYADLVFRYFLRKPFGQELGRKIKIAFSNTDVDDAYTFIHDFGFIPKFKNEDKGFKVLIGGGLGAQPFLAKTIYEFLPETELLPVIEASIRVFDRNGERNNRNKARLKYFVGKIGVEAFVELVKKERKAIQFEEAKDFVLVQQDELALFSNSRLDKSALLNTELDPDFQTWVRTNVIDQKQRGFVAAFVKVQLGNITTAQARALADLVDLYAANDLRLTIDQSILLKYILPENLKKVYDGLKIIGLEHAGYNSLADITACPGTDTCNLGISNSTKVSIAIEDLVRNEYPEFLFEQEIKIKISGCMNSCGQHGLAHIGFHGSSIKAEQGTLPALQVLLGGGKLGNGDGRIAEKVIKVPSKRVLDVLRTLLDHYSENQLVEEAFNDYYTRFGNKFFYDLLKPLADTSTVQDSDFIDWGHQDRFKTAIGVGECAGVIIDLVATLLYDAEEKLNNALVSLSEKRYADSIYHAYAAAINAAKAILIENKVHCNTHAGIINDFDGNVGHVFGFNERSTFSDFILEINQKSPSEGFAFAYYQKIESFLQKVKGCKHN